jgi:hypothetical protein
MPIESMIRTNVEKHNEAAAAAAAAAARSPVVATYLAKTRRISVCSVLLEKENIEMSNLVKFPPSRARCFKNCILS